MYKAQNIMTQKIRLPRSNKVVVAASKALSAIRTKRCLVEIVQTSVRLAAAVAAAASIAASAVAAAEAA